MFAKAALFLLSAGSTWMAVPAAQAQVTVALTTVYNFTGNDDGSNPQSLLLGSDGNFYGTAAFGGLYGLGTVFKLTPAGQLTTIYSFTGGNDGGTPDPGLVQDSLGNLYGVAFQNGANNYGTIFQVTTSGAFTVLHSFTNEDGSYPLTSLTQGSDGNFYGVTGSGLFYEVTPSGNYTLLNTSPMYRLISGLALGRDGNFYGAVDAGSSGHAGLVQVSPAGTMKLIGTFTAINGEAEPTFIQGSDGNFYGTTGGDGFSNYGGTVFRLAPDGTYTLLHSFDDPNEGLLTPNSKLFEGSDGNFYGATSTLGTNDGGTLFQITPDGMFTTLYNFSGSDGSGPEEGGNINTQPGSALVLGSDGNLYGTAVRGGTQNSGTIFKLALHPSFFANAVALSNGVYYLAFPDGAFFGYYAFFSDPHYLYHYDLGYEYVFNANDGNNGVYLYDFASSTFFYTSSGSPLPFPYLYDFSLNSVVYYFPDPNNPGRYNTDGVRYFYDFATGQVISK